MARKALKQKAAAKAETPPKPALFIGASVEAIPLLNSIVELLQHQFRVTPWTAGVFEPSGDSPLASLMRQAEKTAYGVFIFAKDDQVKSRGRQYDATRDNVIFELGLFMGILGARNCFVLVPKERGKLKIPSDLQGFGLVTYEDDRVAEEPQAAVAAACAAITNAVARRTKEASATSPEETTAIEASPSPLPDARIAADLQDLLGMVHQGAAGLEVSQREQAKFVLWAKNALHMARLAIQATTRGLPADVYLAWLRPSAADKERLSFFLGENTPPDFATRHHPFSLGEGLAGSVWSEGRAASHSPSCPHPKWRPRADCNNESYVCVPVGKPTGAGGVLGFGSDQGFETQPEQVSVLEVFASILSAAVPADAWWKPDKPRRTPSRH